MFTFGFLFWFSLILIGSIMRGPSWAWYWPSEDWTVPKETAAATRNLPVWWGALVMASDGAVGLIAPALAVSQVRQGPGPGAVHRHDDLAVADDRHPGENRLAFGVQH